MPVKEITLVGTLPPIKGVSDYCIEQTNELARKIRVKFINFSSIYPEFLYPGQGTKENDPVFRRPSGKNVQVLDTLAWWNPLSWLHVGFSARGEILHFHWWTFYLSHVFFAMGLAAKLCGKKIVCTIHNVVGHESGLIDRFLSGIVFLLPDKFIVHTQSNREQLMHYFHVNEKRIEVVPHGVYNFYRDEDISKAEARKKLGVPEKAKVLLLFGNIRPYKGVEELVAAFKSARKDVPGLFLLVAGKPWKNGLSEFLQSELAGIKEKKLSLGYIPSSEIKFYFSAADVVVLPYKHFEAQSGPGNIALAFEKPLIVSDVGGLPELVLDKEMVFGAGNSGQLSARIVQAFSKKGLLKALSGDSARLRQEYSWGNICAKTLKIYNGLLA